MREKLENIAHSIKAEYVEVRYEESDRLLIRVRNNRIERATKTKNIGGYVRVYNKGGWGFATFTNLKDLEKAGKMAEQNAKFFNKDKIKLAPIEPVRTDLIIKLEKDKDPREYSLKDKLDIALNYSDKIKRYDPRIIVSASVYVENFSRVYILTNEGTNLLRETLDFAGSVSAVARKDNVVQALHESFGSKDNFKLFYKLDEKIEPMVEQVLKLLSAKLPEAGQKTVILDPRLAGVFIHEAFGHLSEADHVAENKTLIEQMKIGRDIGSPILNVLDGGSGDFAHLRGSFIYDDEGVLMKVNHLIKDGILVGRLHSRYTAGAMGEEPTGNSRTVSFEYSPICRMTNTCIDRGESTFEEMLSDVKDGYYLLGSGGGTTNMEMFTFAAEYGYKIKDGKLTDLIRDIMLTGNVFVTLKNIDKIGNDLVWSQGGNCGKTVGHRLHYPLTVTMGAPHIRIKNVLIGGR